VMPKDTVARYSRVGLLLAAFALVAAIIVQPLWRTKAAARLHHHGRERPKARPVIRPDAPSLPEHEREKEDADRCGHRQHSQHIGPHRSFVVAHPLACSLSSVARSLDAYTSRLISIGSSV
jgi:hypothetical protein